MESAITTALKERPPERDIYRAAWAMDDYRNVAPGENCVREFLLQARPRIGATIADLGCGTGRASLLLALPPPMGASLKVKMLDFADNCLDKDMRDMLVTQSGSLEFIEADLTKPLPVITTYGFCTDVMEHIPTQDVNTVLNNCLMACEHVFFQISTVDDVFGERVGHPLHLTVRPYEWWLQKFRDRKCVIHWSRDYGNACAFYVTAWTNGKEIIDSGKLNIADELAKANVLHNIQQGWKQVSPHDVSSDEVMILGGGPSMNEFVDEIKAKRAAGVKLITLNGAYNWCIDRGITPSAQIIVDARPHNARFTKPVIDTCRYLICSQCDPSVLEGLPHENTYLWHTGAELHREALDLAYDKKWYWVPGGSTVLLRAIPLMRMLGYKRFHLYGCDSCVISEAQHHSYEQKENDGEILLPTVTSNSDRVFMTTVWQASQASEFIDIIKMMGDEIELEIYGDGLLAHILKTGAEVSAQEEFNLT